ncbi:uncharacterized protein LOC142620384 [Castanea sativa]|uniref:uncharacterized protein LOC142620384 n=1 Tax=Castanea sativa TaxID=21020 RepID=UPI003F654195
MTLWALELSEFDVRYQPRTAVKGQVIVNFIGEFTFTEDQGAEEAPMWSIHTNGSSNKHTGGVSVVLHTPEGDKIECMLRLDFSTTNNKAEHEALIVGLDLAIATGANSMIVYSDSQIVISQINGSYECKNERMKKYLEEVKAEQVLSFVQLASLIDGTSVQEVSDEHCWMTPIAAYLRDGKLPDDKEAVRKLKAKASWFVLIKNILYRRGFSRPYLRCLASEESNYVMREVHEGIYGNHSGSRSLVHKLL